MFSDRNKNNAILVGLEDGWQNQHQCAYIPDVPANNIKTVSCTPDTPVRYLTIRHDYRTNLGICEVIVNGYKYESEYTLYNDVFKRKTFNCNHLNVLKWLSM